MREIIISFDHSNPTDFFGINDSYVDLFRKNFPTLKLIARGNELKAQGDKAHLEAFQSKMNLLTSYYKRKGSMDENTIEEIFNGSDKKAPSKPSDDSNEILVYGQNGILIRARTANQKLMVESSERNDIVFAIGPAGTGKTYTAVALAVRALKNREIRRIILCRPAVEAGENLGFLPGDLKEKIDPYLRPLYDALYDMMPGEKVASYIESGVIEVAPLAFMRGRTLDNAFVILDEAQNATESQLKMFLTRMGPSAKFIVTGDVTQIDLPKSQPSGLLQAIKLLDKVEGITFVHLTGQDVVRHRLVKNIIEAYSKI